MLEFLRTLNTGCKLKVGEEQGWGQYYPHPLTQGHLSPLRLGMMTALNVLSTLRFVKPLGIILTPPLPLPYKGGERLRAPCLSPTREGSAYGLRLLLLYLL